MADKQSQQGMLSDMLGDARAHYKDVEARALKRLAEMPKGSIQKRRIRKGGIYYYLKVRDGKVVRQKYVGKEPPVDLQKQIEERHLLLNRLKYVRKNLMVLERANKDKYRAR